MAIVKTITDDYYFWNWVKNSDSYSNNFTLQGAKAMQEYLEEHSNDIGENIEFDPIAWCVEFSEYKDMEDFYNSSGYTTEDIQSYEDLLDRTSVIGFDGGFILADF